MPNIYPTDPTFAAKIYWTIPDPVPPSVYASIAEQVAEGSISVDPDFVSTVGWHLSARHIIAWGNALTGLPTIVNGVIVNFGACGQPGGIGIAGGIASPSQNSGLVDANDAGLAAGLASQAGTTTISVLGGVNSAANVIGDTATSILSDIPVVGAIANLVLLPFTLIFEHHAQAVATEQGDICSCSSEINQWLDQVDNAVATGQILPAEGVTYVQQLANQYNQCVSAISAACTPGNINAACDYKAVMEAMVLLRTWMYSNLPQFNAQASQPAVSTNIVSNSATLFASAETTPGSGVSLSIAASSPALASTSPILLILLAIAAMFFL